MNCARYFFENLLRINILYDSNVCPQTTVKSTTTSTSLISSMTQCYIADPAITVACMRKKKSIDSAPIEGMEEVDAGMISPSSPKVASKDEDLNQVRIIQTICLLRCFLCNFVETRNCDVFNPVFPLFSRSIRPLPRSLPTARLGSWTPCSSPPPPSLSSRPRPKPPSPRPTASPSPSATPSESASAPVKLLETAKNPVVFYFCYKCRYVLHSFT